MMGARLPSAHPLLVNSAWLPSAHPLLVNSAWLPSAHPLLVNRTWFPSIGLSPANGASSFKTGLLAALLLCGCSTRTSTPPPPEPADAAAAVKKDIVYRSYRAMGTQIGFQAFTDDPERAHGAFEAAIAEFRRLEDLHSNWKPKSDVSLINLRAGERPVRVAPETIELISLAQQMHGLTEGKFDVGFGAIADLWRFDHDQTGVVPDPEQVKARLPLVDASRIQVDASEGTVFLPRAGMSVHVGGIGKGYAVDRAVAVLRERGLRDFTVQAGGDFFAAGRRGDRPWRVGIRDPRGPPQSYFASAELEDRTFSTSGDYERFFMKDGRRYHHIIDPDTGAPAQGCRSVTIIAPTAVLADALSTGVFLLGPNKGLALVESLEGVGAVIVTAENQVIVSKRAASRTRLLHPPTPE